ncbi:MAG TPA: HyaD/HybD family hydrogenase maturation endopeptidase [Candidatus Thiothrix moscowensis]|uniref:HyaD/HybD family hydrogenase maturation endopeptidase n=1 Tax=unclassified Thiothrix TaxID=2636184 RepID=UPI0025F74C2E|nr:MULTISPECIES: HyaD/HybD family hydrogenase maturation endopeptidase [unclassified Thiothrix]HRJ54575.1 HyaD/HybD family hydrogenase maturation endopeptidase [Candidatus Thiothrix moscowensis]HRJ94949.1 HyaD/HybD family hydrogenase maturation endopeptidase [Candidatus Thiothrix moscowensis]
MSQKKVLILGIGNLLWADEGFGVRAMEYLHTHYQFPDHVQLLDGGTQGIYLVQYVEEADILVVFDAIDYGLAPGTLKRIEDGEVPRFMGAKKMSLHQTGFQEVLAMAQLLDRYPEHLLLIGVQPVELEDFGGSLRPEVKAQIEPAAQLALTYLAEHGIHAIPRPQLQADQTPGHAALHLHDYETQRPSAAQACRIGDERFLGRIQYEPA